LITNKFVGSLAGARPFLNPLYNHFRSQRVVSWRNEENLINMLGGIALDAEVLVTSTNTTVA